MQGYKDQRLSLKHYFQLGKSASEAYKLLRAEFGDDSIRRSCVYDWYSRFKSGRMSVEDLDRSGRPLTSRTSEKIEKVRKVIEQDRRISFQEISRIIGISHGSCHRIVRDDLQMRSIFGKHVPKILTQKQKEHRITICKKLQEEVINDSNFLSKVVIGGECWVYGNKKMDNQLPRSKRKIKLMLICFFNAEGILHVEYVQEVSNINENLYINCFTQLKKSLKEKWKDQPLLLHYDSPTDFTTLSMKEFFNKNKIELIDHNCYSPDLTACDFFLFPKLKTLLKDRKYQNADEIHKESLEILRSISKSEFKMCFEQWEKQWERCINSLGDYFEED
ncbi:UNVERIFIED_CONTAM: hypothetical protein RMT77_015949 [Armadillidium vulgare]